MKKHTLAFVLVPFIIFFAAKAHCETEACCDAAKIADAAVTEWTDMTSDIFDNYLKEPDFSSIDDCLEGIGNFSLGIGISLPSLQDIINSACNFVKGKVLDEISGVTSQMSSKYSLSNSIIGANVNSGYSVYGDGTITQGYQVNDTSDQVLNSIWDSIQ